MTEPLIVPAILRHYLRSLGADDLLVNDEDLALYVDNLVTFGANYQPETLATLTPRALAQVSHFVVTSPRSTIQRAWASSLLPDASDTTKIALACIVGHLLHPRGHESDVEPVRMNRLTVAALWRGVNPESRDIERVLLAEFHDSLIDSAVDASADTGSVANERIPGLVRNLTVEQLSEAWDAHPELGPFDEAAAIRYQAGVDAYWSQRLDQPEQDVIEGEADPNALIESTVAEIMGIVSEVYAEHLGAVVDRGLLRRLDEAARARLIENMAA